MLCFIATCNHLNVCIQGSYVEYYLVVISRVSICVRVRPDFRVRVIVRDITDQYVSA